MKFPSEYPQTRAQPQARARVPTRAASRPGHPSAPPPGTQRPQARRSLHVPNSPKLGTRAPEPPARAPGTPLPPGLELPSPRTPRGSPRPPWPSDPSPPRWGPRPRGRIITAMDWRVWRSWFLAAAVGAGSAGLIASLYDAHSAIPAVYGAGLGGGVTLLFRLLRLVDWDERALAWTTIGFVVVLLASVTSVSFRWGELPYAVAVVGMPSVVLLGGLSLPSGNQGTKTPCSAPSQKMSNGPSETKRNVHRER